jgi:hypothetical protein
LFPAIGKFPSSSTSFRLQKCKKTAALPLLVASCHGADKVPRRVAGFECVPVILLIGILYFYIDLRNFPKLFLKEGVEKKRNPMPVCISVAFPQCVNI